MGYISRTLVACMLLFFVAACGERSEKNTNAHSQETVVENGIVKNAFFKLSFEPIEDWYLLSDQELRQLLNLGERIATAESEDLGRIVEATREANVAIFGIFEHAPGSPVPLNPNVLVQAEDVSHAPGVKTGADYYFHTKQVLRETGLNFVFGETLQKKSISGIEFDQMNVSLTYQGQEVKQRYYATRYEDYILMIIESGYGEGTAAVLDRIVLDW